MKRTKIQRFTALLVALIMTLTSFNVTALASGNDDGVHADSSSDGISGAGGTYNPGATSNYEGVIQRAGGGWKLSILRMDIGAYKGDSERYPQPLYDNKRGGATPISITGPYIPAEYHTKNGRYGIGSIYFTSSNRGEYGIDINLNLAGNQSIENYRVKKSDITAAARKVGVTNDSIANSIWSAFGNQTNILNSITDFNSYLSMVAVDNATEQNKDRNEQILNTILQLVVDKYGATSAVGEEITRLRASETEEYAILIEPMAQISINRVASFITASNWAMYAYNINPRDYVEMHDFNYMMSNRGKANKAFTDGMSTYFTGLRGDDKNYTGVIGRGLGGTNTSSLPDRQPFSKRESIFSKVIFTGWISGARGVERANLSSYKNGWGTLVASDFTDVAPPITEARTKTSSSSISVIGQKSGITPNISVGLTTTENTLDGNLNRKVLTAIRDLDEYSNDRGVTLDNIENQLSSGTLIDILRIILDEYSPAYLVQTSVSNKEEDITGKI